MKNYDQFYREILFESIFQVDSNFMEILNKISDDPISNKIKGLVDQDIETQYNFIQRGEKEDQVYFLPDSQGQKTTNPWSKKNNSAKIGRLVNQILNYQGISVVPAEIEKFVNRYKTAWKEVNTIQDPIQLVSGEEIKKWYYYKTYEDNEEGTLGNSCMRYNHCQNYFRIYIENPEVCQLAILLNEDGKLIGRCLVWKMENGQIYIDRIYTRWDSDIELMYNNLKKKFPNSLSYSDGDHEEDELSVILIQDYSVEFQKIEKDVNLEFPYMDSLCYFYPLTNRLSNQGDSSQYCIRIQSTSGEFTNYSELTWSNYSENFINKSDYTWTGNDWLPISVVDLDVFGNYYKKEELTYSDLYKGLIYDPIQTDWGLCPASDLTQVGELKVPNIFKNNDNYDPLKYPVFTWINGGYHLIKNLKKSIDDSNIREAKGFLIKEYSQPLLIVSHPELMGKLTDYGSRKWITFYYKNYPIGISNIVGRYGDGDLTDNCYIISEWLELLPLTLDSKPTSFYIDSIDKFRNLLSQGISGTGTWDVLLEIEKNEKMRGFLNDSILLTDERLTEPVIRYIENFFQKIKDHIIPLIESDTQVNYNLYLKEEYSKKDLLKDPLFMDLLMTIINCWWISLGNRSLRDNDQFDHYFLSSEHKSNLIESILDKIVYPVYRDFKKNNIILSLEDNINYQRELIKMKLFN